jgi:hypothetical protein
MALMFIGLTLFQTGLQAAQIGISMGSDINNEVQRQQGICDQIKDIKENQIPRLQSMRADLAKGQALSDTTKQELLTISDTINATINQINDMSRSANTKYLIQVVASIITVALVALYIVQKKSS